MLTHALGKNLNKMRDQWLYVLSAFSHGWNQDRENIQPIIKITAELIPTDHLCEIAMCGCNQADVDLMGPAASKPLELLFLQNPEQLWL
jgi:hypothetical protein